MILPVKELFYFVYITTNQNRSSLSTGITGDLSLRLYQLQYRLIYQAHRDDCILLLYWEQFEDVNEALLREKELRKLSRRKKESLINRANPEWRVLNQDI